MNGMEKKPLYVGPSGVVCPFARFAVHLIAPRQPIEHPVDCPIWSSGAISGSNVIPKRARLGLAGLASDFRLRRVLLPSFGHAPICGTNQKTLLGLFLGRHTKSPRALGRIVHLYKLFFTLNRAPLTH